LVMAIHLHLHRMLRFWIWKLSFYTKFYEIHALDEDNKN